MRNKYKIFIGRSEGKRKFGRPRQRWENNIKVGRKENGGTVHTVLTGQAKD
jgi:hypothetical protein